MRISPLLFAGFLVGLPVVVSAAKTPVLVESREVVTMTPAPASGRVADVAGPGVPASAGTAVEVEAEAASAAMDDAASAASDEALLITPAAGPVDPVVADPAVTDRVMRAIALVGVPYRMGGSSPETGFDCSGLVAWVFRDTVDYKLPRSADGLYRMSGEERALPVAREELATGDLVFFSIGRLGNRIDHVGIATGDGRFLHAPSSGGIVRLDSLDLPYWKKHYAGARRLPVALAVQASPVKDQAMIAEVNPPASESTDTSTAP